MTEQNNEEMNNENNSDTGSIKSKDFNLQFLEYDSDDDEEPKLPEQENNTNNNQDNQEEDTEEENGNCKMSLELFRCGEGRYLLKLLREEGQNPHFNEYFLKIKTIIENIF